MYICINGYGGKPAVWVEFVSNEYLKITKPKWRTFPKHRNILEPGNLEQVTFLGGFPGILQLLVD